MTTKLIQELVRLSIEKRGVKVTTFRNDMFPLGVIKVYIDGKATDIDLNYVAASHLLQAEIDKVELL